MATGNIREKKTKKGEIRYQITIECGNDELTGNRQRIYKNVRGSKREAKALMHRMIIEAEQGIATQKNNKKVGEWMDEWVSTYLPNIEETTRVGYKTKIRCYIKPAIGDILLKSLKTEHIQKMVNDMNTTLSPKNIRDTFNNVNAAMKKAVKLRLIPYNPCEAVELPKLKKYHASVYPPSMIQKLLNRRLLYRMVPYIIRAIRKGRVCLLPNNHIRGLTDLSPRGMEGYENKIWLIVL